MKHCLYVIGILAAILLFGMDSDSFFFHSDRIAMNEEKAVVEQTAQRHQEQCKAILSEDLKNGNLLTRNRTFQVNTIQINVRCITQSERQIQYFRLKGCDLLAKLTAITAIDHFVNYTAILCSKGYHVFALRKLLI